MINKDLETQIRLLEDPDKQIYSLIYNNIIGQGEGAIPLLEQAWSNSLVPLVHQRIENMIHEISFNQTLSDFEDWVQLGRKDWFHVYYLLSKFYYQDIAEESLLDIFSKIRNDIWLEINDNLTAFEKIQIVNYILFKKYKFINTSNPQSKSSFFLSELLDNKKGNDLSLSILYLLICNSLELPVYGVDLPGNSILVYLDSNPIGKGVGVDEEALFYINPFNNGTVFGKHEIEIYIEKNKLESSNKFFNAIGNQLILEKYLKELIKSLKQDGEGERVAELEKIMKILS